LLHSGRDPAQPEAQNELAAQPSEDQIADAKKALCDAHAFVDRATQTAGRQTSDDPAVKAAVAVNIRLTSTLSASYLLSELQLNPSAPPELEKAVRKLAKAYQETTLTHISDAPETEIDAVYARLDLADSKVDEACA